MNLNEILDRKLFSYLDRHLTKSTIVTMCSSIGAKPKFVIDKIDDLLMEVDYEYEGYLIQKLLEYFNSEEFFTENNITAYTSNTPEAYERFVYNFTLVKDHLILKLNKLSIKIDDEIFTDKEFDDLKDMLYDISKNIYDIQKKQDAAHEVLYDSINEIHEELIKNAEKGRVFGKEFVKEQLAGKVIDMTFKGGAGAFLTKFTTDFGELPSFIKGLL